MSDLSFTRDFACGRDRVLELLQDPDFLTQFVTQQDPVEHDVTVDPHEPVATISWVVSTGGMPGIARRFVGDAIPIRMVITSPGVTSDEDGSLSLALEGKVKGQLQASLAVHAVDEHLPNTVMTIRGSFTMNAGLLSGKASDMARDHLVVPLLGKLADLIQEWCSEPSS